MLIRKIENKNKVKRETPNETVYPQRPLVEYDEMKNQKLYIFIYKWNSLYVHWNESLSLVQRIRSQCGNNQVPLEVIYNGP